MSVFESVDGVPCHQLSFESPGADWQIWIEADSTPVPRRFVIDFVDEDNHQMHAYFGPVRTYTEMGHDCWRSWAAFWTSGCWRGRASKVVQRLIADEVFAISFEEGTQG
jgi:hypothetical protein